jgi:hypothetical protein
MMAETESTSTGAPAQQERPTTLDDMPAQQLAAVQEQSDSRAHCDPSVCQYGDKITDWCGHDNYECSRCGRATLDIEEVKVRNPDFQPPKKRGR